VRDIEIRDFDGDLQALSAMAHDAWLEEYGQDIWPDLYRPALTRYLFADTPDPRFLIAAYHGAKLVAFVANLPRTYRLNGRTYRGVAPCMLVARKGYRGVALYLIAECQRRIQEFGADFALMTLERKHRSWRIFEKHVKRRYRIEVLRTMHTILRFVDLEAVAESQNSKWYEVAAVKLLGAHRPLTAPAVSGAARRYRETDLDAVLALTRRYSDRNSLVRVFDQKSLARRLHTEDVASTVVFERDGSVKGFINFTTHDMVNMRSSHRWAWVDFVYWEGLSGQEKQALLAGLWEASRELGCIGILEWNKNYYATGALYRSHFIPYPRHLDLIAWIPNADLSLRGIDSVVEQVI
jgi:hypothetical protein